MLSQENIDKLCMTGIYECDVVKSWLPSYKRDTPYHCCNWTFKVRQGRKDTNTYYMEDTYWSTGDNLCVELTDENFGLFRLLFDMNEVSKINPPDFYDYDKEDRWHVALDSGGWQYSKHYYVRKGAVKNKKTQLDRLYGELKSLERQVQIKKDEIYKIECEFMKPED